MVKLDEFLLPNASTCIVACAATTARFWTSDSRFGKWTLLAELRAPDAAKHEIQRFAREIAGCLNRGVASGTFKHIVIIATPGLLGHLRTELSDNARRAVALEASKNLSGLDVDEVQHYFR